MIADFAFESILTCDTAGNEIALKGTKAEAEGSICWNGASFGQAR